MLGRTDKKTLATTLRHRIDIKGKEEVSNGAGGFVETWVVLATVWASVDPIKASQHYRYNSTNVDATHHIVVRGGTQITEDQVIVFDSREFEVLAIEDIQERGVYLFITAKERR
jgi:SPP1 family predicted phage head-tail adaptor